MKILLTCPCGASAQFEGGTFINGGGKPDARGRVFLVELRAEEWLDRHKHCKSPKALAPERCQLNTELAVLAKDGSLRDVCVCTEDTPEEIGRRVIDAIHGSRLFQLSTLKCRLCGNYANPSYLPKAELVRSGR